MHAAAHARRSTHWSQWQADTGPPTPRSSPDWPEPPCWASPTPCESADHWRQPPGAPRGVRRSAEASHWANLPLSAAKGVEGAVHLLGEGEDLRADVQGPCTLDLRLGGEIPR